MGLDQLKKTEGKEPMMSAGTRAMEATAVTATT